MQGNPSFRDDLRQAIELAGCELFGTLKTKPDKKKLPTPDSEDFKVW